MWDYDPPKPKQRKSTFPEFTQADFRTMAKGGVKLAFVSIYPIEQGWFNPRILGDGGASDFLARVIAKLPMAYVNKVQGPDFRYHDYFLKEYRYLLEENTMPHDVDGEVFRYILIRPGDDIDAVLSMENAIGVILTIEGAQSLMDANAEMIDTNSFSMDQFLQNINDAKRLDYPPFFVSLCHHFNNGICGHVKTFPGIAGFLFNQEKGMDLEINSNGWLALKCFLGLGEFEGNGQRILIDTKHMSIRARQQYYEFIKDYNDGQNEQDKIPIVVSHTGYSGHASMEEAIQDPDSDDKYDESAIFNNWSINICDDEIIHVFNSGGLIGLNFDERILTGSEVMKTYKDRFGKRDIKNRSLELQKFWAQQMLNHILGIVRVVVYSAQLDDALKVRIWDMISIGTDFDGMINAVDAYLTSEEFIDLRNILLEIMPLQDNIGHLLQGLSVEHALEKIMYENAYQFARRHYMNI